jgi:tRNA-Thr(GGU) m(6)t(6)A37 methyltransferase TsaA
MEFKPIGIIHTPFTEQSGTPIQPVYGQDAQGEVEIFEEYAEGLDDIDGFERIWLIFYLDRSRPAKLKQVPYRDTVERGVFSIRSPSRPNPIGISAVRLLGRNGNRLTISDIDILDGTPLLDIKPYIPRIDSWPDAKGGWFETVRGERKDVKSADGRFGGSE